MFDIYLSLPAWIRTTVAIIVLGVGIFLTISGKTGESTESTVVAADGTLERVVETRTYPGIFRAGMVVTGVGALLLLTCGKSKSEKGGYNF